MIQKNPIAEENWRRLPSWTPRPGSRPGPAKSCFGAKNARRFTSTRVHML